jgi:hypothetical protein
MSVLWVQEERCVSLSVCVCVCVNLYAVPVACKAASFLLNSMYNCNVFQVCVEITNRLLSANLQCCLLACWNVEFFPCKTVTF